MKLVWKWPYLSPKAHVFDDEGDGISLCGKWAYTGESQGEFKPEEPARKDDCKACYKKAIKYSAKEESDGNKVIG